MDSLSNCLPSSLKELKLSQHFFEQSLRHEWKDIAGPLIDKNTKIISIESPIIKICVFNSAWMQQLSMQKRQLLKKINEFYGSTLMTDIRFEMYGQLSDSKENNSILAFGDNIDKKIDFTKIVLSIEENKEIDEMLSTVENTDLIEIMRQVLVCNKKREKFLLSLGNHHCPICGRMIYKEQEICISCMYKRHRNKIIYLMRLIKKYPTLKFDEFIVHEDPYIQRIFSYITMKDFNEARSESIYQLLDLIYHGSEDRIVMYQLARLITFKKDEELTEAFVLNLANKYKSKWIKNKIVEEKYVSSHRLQSDGFCR